MARIRSVHPGLASDEAYMSMSIAAKAAWPVLWCECDDHGIFEWKPVVLKARIFPADNLDFNLLLEEWLSLGVVMRVEFEGRSFGLVKNFGKYQRPKSPSYRYLQTEVTQRQDWCKFIGIKCSNSTSLTPELPQSCTSTTEKSPQMKEVGGRREEEGSKQRSRVELDLIESNLRLAAKVENDPAPGLMDLSPVLGLLDAGYSLEEDVLPIVRARTKPNSKPRTWSFYTEAIREARARRLSISGTPAPAAPEVTAGDWDDAVDRFKRTGVWPGYIKGKSSGPEPGYDGCKAPREVLVKYGYLKLQAAE